MANTFDIFLWTAQPEMTPQPITNNLKGQIPSVVWPEASNGVLKPTHIKGPAQAKKCDGREQAMVAICQVPRG